MNFLTAVFSNPGGRDKNEDSAGHVYKAGEYGAWVVADGLGGHHAGEKASSLAVNSMLSLFQQNPILSEKNLEHVFSAANGVILSEQMSERKYRDMRTTAVGLFTNLKEVIWAHVGDSRLYFFRNGKLAAQTKDHSVSQLAVSSGEITFDQIRFHEDRNRLLRVLGTNPDLKVDMLKKAEAVVPGDAFLLCTDGFWEYVYESEMEVDLVKAFSPEHWLELLVSRLIKRVNGSHDNFTAIGVIIE